MWPKKISLFFFDNNVYKNKETFKIFSPQILEVYRILLVQTTLESITFYYTFIVINNMFDPSTTPKYDSSNSNIKIVYKSIEHFLWNLSDFSSDVVLENLSCLWIVFINSVFQLPPQKIVRMVEICEIEWSGVIGSTRNESVPWKVLPEEFKCCNNTVFISMPLFFLNAGANFRRIISIYRPALMVTQFPSLSSKNYGPKIPLCL